MPRSSPTARHAYNTRAELCASCYYAPLCGEVYQHCATLTIMLHALFVTKTYLFSMLPYAHRFHFLAAYHQRDTLMMFTISLYARCRYHAPRAILMLLHVTALPFCAAPRHCCRHAAALCHTRDSAPRLMMMMICLILFIIDATLDCAQPPHLYRYV